MKVLVLGGTRFFGKILTEKLIAAGHEVHVASRGNTPVPPGAQAHLANRDDKDSLKKLGQQSWDVVYDQICFSSNNAQTLTEAFWDNIGHLVYTSSMAVYDLGADQGESNFDPLQHKLLMHNRREVPYGEGKRNGEAYYFQKSTFPVSAVRFPIVMGLGDPTERFEWHINKIRQKQPVYFPDLKARMIFVSSHQAADFLKWCGEKKITGPINGSSPEPISMGQLMDLFQEHLQQPMVSADKATEENHSPYGIDSDWFMSMKKAQDLGYDFEKLQDWLPQLLKQH